LRVRNAAKDEAGIGIPRLIQIRFDDAGPCLRRLLDLSRKGLLNLVVCLYIKTVNQVLVRAKDDLLKKSPTDDEFLGLSVMSLARLTQL
jgi:hypothetical protein